jgi:hypothetical protein
MSYNNEKEQMNKEMQTHKQRVMLVIKITFIVFAVALLALAVSIIISLVKGGLFSAGKDDTPPVIEARQGTTVVGYIGEAPTYKKYVTVSDDKDDDINYYEMESYAYDINRKYDKEKDKSDDFEIGM